MKTIITATLMAVAVLGAGSAASAMRVPHVVTAQVTDVRHGTDRRAPVDVRHSTDVRTPGDVRHSTDVRTPPID